MSGHAISLGIAPALTPERARVDESEYQPFPNESGRNWRQERVEIPLMLAVLSLPRGARVLEVGCGRGIALPVFDRLLTPARLVGLDIDPMLLTEAEQRLTETGTPAELIPGDVRNLPFPDGSFDVVIDFGTCFHVGRPGDALREIARVLVPGGIFATETKLSQLLAHPVRSKRRHLPWAATAELAPLRRALLWQSRWRRAV
jgi:ubiquinone/menaquinone biosynthesis C-methylase UbiE